MDWKCQFCGKTVNCAENEIPAFCPQCGKKNCAEYINSAAPAVDGTLPPKRKIGLTIFLLVITLGIYSFFLIYSWVRTLNFIAEKKKYNPALLTALIVGSSILEATFSFNALPIPAIIFSIVEPIIFLYIVDRLRKETINFQNIGDTIKNTFTISVICVIIEFFWCTMSETCHDEDLALFFGCIGMLPALIRYGKVQAVINTVLSRIPDQTVNNIAAKKCAKKSNLMWNIITIIAGIIIIVVFYILVDSKNKTGIRPVFPLGMIVYGLNGVINYFRNKGE